MAVAEYVPTPVPVCVDTPDVNQWLQNLNGLMEAALQGTGGVTCSPVRDIIADGECLTVDTSEALKLSGFQNAEGVIEKKIFMLSAKVSIDAIDFAGSNFNNLHPSNQQLKYTVTVMCGGVPIAGSGILSGQAGTSSVINANMVGECVAGLPLEVCFDVVFDTIPPEFERPNASIHLCGAMLCVTEASRGFIDDIPGFFCAPNVPPGCLIGREGIHLMQQNTRALCSYAAQGYLEASCDFSATFNDDDSHVLAQPQSDVQYLIVGSAVICAANAGSPLAVTVSAQISGGCSNGSTARCFQVSRVLNRTGAEGDVGSQECFTVPFITCGNCLAGGSIFAGLSTSTVCGDSDSSITAPGAVIQSVSQTYTLFTFRRVDPIAEGLLPVFEEQPIDKCISRESVEYLVDKADSLFDYFCSRTEQQIGCTNISEGFGPITSGVIFSGVIRPPSAPPPPPEPVPTSKVNVFCQLSVCFRSLDRLFTQFATLEITISCAGAAPYTIPINQLLIPSQQNSSDGIEDIGGDTLCRNIPIVHTYTGCLVTDPVQLDITMTGTGIEATGSFNCLSFNI